MTQWHRIWRWLIQPSSDASDRQTVRLVLSVDHFARLQERQRVYREVQELVEYYERQLATLSEENKRLRKDRFGKDGQEVDPSTEVVNSSGSEYGR